MSDYTELVVLLDRSGSMQDAKSDHEGGLRSFIEDQKTLPGDVRFTLIQFDTNDPCEVIYDGVPLSEVADVTLIPRGGTPLLDAIFKALAHVEKRLTGKSPSQVMFMIIADGEENSSTETNKAQVQKRIAELEAKNWTVLYLGANVDAFHEAAQLGTSQARSAQFANDAIGVAAMYDDLKGKAFITRNCLAGAKPQFEYTDEDRAKLMGGVQASPTVQPVAATSAVWTSPDQHS